MYKPKKIFSALTLAILLASPTVLSYELYNTNSQYSQGSKVEHNGNIYQAKWWAKEGDTPGKIVTAQWKTPWELVGQLTS